MPQKLIPEALAAWREGERLLQALPPLSPDHETVALAVAQLRDVYSTLTTSSDVTASALSSSRSTVEQAARVIAEAKRRP